MLQHTRCAGADFHGANLVYADFSHADMTDARVDGARWERTKFHRARREGLRLPDGASILFDDPELLAAETWAPGPLPH